MGYIFRINKTKGASKTTIVDWSNTPNSTYHHGFVDKIPDTTTTQREITSIPSPFARIELVKEAFGKIVPETFNEMNVDEVKEMLHGATIYHKMVSDSLDVGQIFFSYEAMKDQVDIIVWEKDKCLDSLLSSNEKSHQIYGKTLSMFLSQDAEGDDPYNFGKMQNIYILRYKGKGKRQMHIIGATSPATLFFSTANDENSISKELCFGTDYAFDKEFASLDERATDYIKYLFAFRYSEPRFNALYPEVAKYLDAVYFVLNDDLKDELDAIRDSCAEQVEGTLTYVDKTYDKLSVDVNTTTNYQVEVNGRPLHFKRYIDPVQQGDSDFRIRTSKSIDGKTPLVLPVTNSNAYKSLNYYGTEFGTNHSVPYYDKNNLGQRRLPGINIPYPYLTISDFLEDKIIKLPSEVNKTDFFDGNYYSNSNAKEGYLLPISNNYFNYFTVDELKGKAPSGKNTIDIKQVASGVEVTLRIPIQKKLEVEYKRIYTLDVKADKENNKGAIVLPPEDFAVGVMPPVKFAQETDAHYRVILMGYYNLCKEFACECHDNSGFFTPDFVVRNVDIESDTRSKVYYLDGRTFDCARIAIKTAFGKENTGSGIMVPNFKSRSGSGSLSFAIDLGTSNTHIEYSEGDNSLPKPFEYGTDQPQIGLLFALDKSVMDHVRGEFIPESIGNDSVCKFPMRTVLCIDKNNSGVNESGKGGFVAFGNASPAFMYNKTIVGPLYNEYVPNLKWSQINYTNEERIRCYIESLFMMIRTKVIQLGASVSQTQIKWFYPISMSPIKQGLFQRIWEQAYRKYFNPTGTPVSITESVAPYSFFQKTRSDVSDIVTIDIGGGTTDIVVADSHGVKCVSSMRFAADAIFGNTLVSVDDGRLNGIIRQFKESFIANLTGTTLKKMLQDLTEGDLGNSSEVASFLFSLSDNNEIKEANLTDKVDFNSVLMRDTSQKIVFFIFYTAIIYHLAKLMQVKGLNVPSNIAFSGNGSKVINVLSPNKSSLEKLTTVIFKLVFTDVDIVKDIKLIINSVNPKEATCKGGLFLKQEPNNIQSAKSILLADKLLEDETYKDVEDLYEDVVSEVQRYADFLVLKLARDKSISLSGDFGIDSNSLALAVDCFNEDLKTYIEKGVATKLNSGDVGLQDPIEETLFFYPIIGVMNSLSDKICDL